tara:strand:+ start:865 stop:1497 length:633 start_codon:yes stop_codon:yes gene_type:complete
MAVDLKKKKLMSATYTNSERTNVEVLWSFPDTSEVMAVNVPVDSSDPQYKELMSLISFDDLLDMTAERNRQARRDFELATVAIGQQEGWIPKVKVDDTRMEAGDDTGDGSQQDHMIDTGEAPLEGSPFAAAGIKTEQQIREEIYKDLSSLLFSKEVPEDKKAKEFIFMTKLYLFDREEVMNSKNKELKKEARRAKTPFETLKKAILLLDD